MAKEFPKQTSHALILLSSIIVILVTPPILIKIEFFKFNLFDKSLWKIGIIGAPLPPFNKSFFLKFDITKGCFNKKIFLSKI